MGTPSFDLVESSCVSRSVLLEFLVFWLYLTFSSVKKAKIDRK